MIICVNANLIKAKAHLYLYSDIYIIRISVVISFFKQGNAYIFHNGKYGVKNTRFTSFFDNEIYHNFGYIKTRTLINF